MPKFEESLKRFCITAEIPPPKGSSVAASVDIARSVSARLDGINVTDNQRGMMRMSALVFCHYLKEAGCEPIWQVSCRDRNRLALQSDMLGAMALGVENLCAMTGDFPAMGDNPHAKAVYDIDAVQLIAAAEAMGKGVLMNGKTVKDFRPFHVGAVINPFYEPFDLELLKTKKKIAAGAKYFQSQPFFDVGQARAFADRVRGMGAKFLLGVTPLKGPKMVNFLNERVLTTPIPEGLSRRIADSADPAEEGLRAAAEFVHSAREFADGVHLMPIGQEEKLPRLLDMIDGLNRP